MENGIRIHGKWGLSLSGLSILINLAGVAGPAMSTTI